MIKLFKRLWAFLFGAPKTAEPVKNITEKAIELIQKEKEKSLDNGPVKVDLSEKKGLGGLFKKKVREIRMKNNRLHIQYNGRSAFNGRGGFRQPLSNGMFRRICAGAMYKHRTDSMRCTKLSRAEQIVGRIEKYCIERAVFKDAGGNEFKII